MGKGVLPAPLPKRITICFGEQRPEYVDCLVYVWRARYPHHWGPTYLCIPNDGQLHLSCGITGKNAASDGTDIGIAFNASLKETWLASWFALTTKENTGLTGTTNTSFTVNPARYQQVCFIFQTVLVAKAQKALRWKGRLVSCAILAG